MGINLLRRARWALPSIAFVAVAGVSASCAPNTPPPDPSCNDAVEAIIAGYPLAQPALGWFSSDTRETGNVQLGDEFAAPTGLGCRAAIFTTGEAVPPSNPANGTALQDKAQLFDYSRSGSPLSDIDEISYWAYRSSASSGGAAPTLALNVQVVGDSVPGNHFTTLVYEPYNQSGGQAAILDDAWQQWDATATSAGDGLWWSTKNGQSNLLTWEQVQQLYPDGQIAGYGFNIGSNNPNQVVAGDGLQFGATVTNF